jgi:hypothetical protein
MSCKESEIVHVSDCNKSKFQTYSSLPLFMPHLTLFHYNIIYVSSKNMINVNDKLNKIWKEATEIYFNVLLKYCIFLIIFVSTLQEEVGLKYNC